MAHGDAREGKWRGNWQLGWVVSTLHTTSEHGVSSITTTDAHTSAASSRLSWRLRRFKWTRPFRRKTKSGFCACAIIFQLASAFKFMFKQSMKDVPEFLESPVTLTRRQWLPTSTEREAEWILESEKSVILALRQSISEHAVRPASSLINIILQLLGFRNEIDVVSVLRFGIASTDNFCLTFRDNLIVSSTNWIYRV